MSDYTADQYREAARKALAAGDTAAAQRLIAAGRAVSQPSAPKDDGAKRRAEMTERLNSPEFRAKQRGPVAEGLASFGTGFARGAAELAGLPGTMQDLVTAGLNKTGLLSDDTADRMQSNLSGGNFRAGMSAATGGGTEYKSPTVAGQYAGTAGEFAPGVVGGSAGAALKYGLLPALASETAGQLTKGTKAEPYARVGAALLTPALLARGAPTARIPGRDPQRVSAANNLERAGVTPTAGQATGSDLLRRVEGAVEPSAKQLAAVTKAAMRKIKSSADDARPTNLKAAQTDIVKRMDEAIEGASVTVPPVVDRVARKTLEQYNRHITAGNRSKVFERMTDELSAFAQNPTKPVPLSQLKMWRQDIGKLTTSSDAATREAAHSFRRLIDRLTDRGLRQSGKAANIGKLEVARNDYRNYLAVEDAATRAGAEGGMISPTQLNQSVIRTQGRKNYATGQGTDMMSFARDATELLRPMPTVQAGGVRGVQNALPMSGAAAGYYMGGVPGAIAGASAPLLFQGMARSPVMQNMIKNPAAAGEPLARMTPGLLSQDD